MKRFEERKVYDSSNNSGLLDRRSADVVDLSNGSGLATGEAVAVKHTPGPWRVAAPPDKVCTDYRDEGGSMLDSNWAPGGHAKTIVTCERRSWMAEGEEFANAQLIAAAPELLQVMRECEAYFDQRAGSDVGYIPNEEQKMLALVRDVIWKATA